MAFSDIINIYNWTQSWYKPPNFYDAADTHHQHISQKSDPVLSKPDYCSSAKYSCLFEGMSKKVGVTKVVSKYDMAWHYYCLLFAKGTLKIVHLAHYSHVPTFDLGYITKVVHIKPRFILNFLAYYLFVWH